MLGQDLLVDAGLVVHPLHLADRAELHEVEVALVARGEQGEVAGVAVDAALAQEARAGRDVDLAAHNRLDSGFLARLVEVDGAVHDAVVGDGQGGHLELGRSLHERVDAAGPIEQRELGVVVEVDEGVRGVRHSFGLGVAEPGIVYLALVQVSACCWLDSGSPMREWMADGLMIVGGLTALGGAIRANFAYIRYFRTRGAQPAAPNSRAIASLEFAYTCSVAAVITGGGISVLVLGLVIGSDVKAWTLALPIGLAAGGVLTAAVARRTLAQLRKSG